MSNDPLEYAGVSMFEPVILSRDRRKLQSIQPRIKIGSIPHCQKCESKLYKLSINGHEKSKKVHESIEARYCRRCKIIVTDKGSVFYV